MPKFEVLVTEKYQDVFRIEARNGSEAMAKLGVYLASEGEMETAAVQRWSSTRTDRAFGRPRSLDVPARKEDAEA